MVLRTVFDGVGVRSARAADRAGVDVEDGAADLTLSILEHVGRVDCLAFSVVSTEHAHLQHDHNDCQLCPLRTSTRVSVTDEYTGVCYGQVHGCLLRTSIRVSVTDEYTGVGYLHIGVLVHTCFRTYVVKENINCLGKLISCTSALLLLPLRIIKV